MTGLVMQHVYKIYEDVYATVKDINLEAGEEDRVVITGPVGSGASSILSMIAGMEDISKGEIYINGQTINDIKPSNRKVALVRSNYAMYPEMTVYENLAFGLKLQKYTEEEIGNRVNRAAEILKLQDVLMKNVEEISTYEKQMIALGRAVVKNPEVYLLDEPFANLDDSLKNQAMEELFRLQKIVKKPFVYATSHGEEALLVGTKILVMKDGEVQQIGTPEEVTENPVDSYVADFFNVSASANCKIS